MAHVDRVEARFGLLPLLSRRVAVDRLVLAGPDLRLERDAQGRANWDFQPPAAPAASPAPASSPSGGGGKRFRFALGELDVRDAKIAWRGPAPIEITAPLLSYHAQGGGVRGQFGVRGQTLTLSGTAGPVENASWPIDLRLTGDGVAAALSGTSEAAALTLDAPDLSALSPLAGRPLPALRDVHLSAMLSGAGGAPSLAGPANLHATIIVGGLTVPVTAQIGQAAAFLSGAATPVALHAAAADAALDGKGALSAAGQGELSLSLHAAGLAQLGRRAGVALPPLSALQAQSGVTISAAGATLHGLRMTSAQGDLSATLALAFAPRPSLRGRLTSTHLDLGALAPAPAPPAPSSSPAPAAASPPARAIPDASLPFAALRDVDADLQLNLAEALWRGQTYRQLAAHAVLQDGKLRLDPASIAVGDKALTARIEADATAEPPTAAVTIDGPELPAGPALALVGGPAQSTGTIDLRADLRGRGATLRALAATMDGHAGVAMVNGEVDNAWLQSLLAGTLRAANIPLEAAGGSTVRCAAIRADASAGKVQLRALTLDTSKLKLDGAGVIDLGAETLDLHLRALLRLGAALSVPLQVQGSMLAPQVTLDPGAIAPGRIGIAIGGAAPADTCGPALELARDGHSGAAPAAPKPGNRPINPADLLRGLFR